MRLQSIHYFRGIAILIIVAGHCYNLLVPKPDCFSERLLANWLNGGTALFVFISGFLFHHIYAKNFNYRSFMVKKLKVVYLPYLILSVIILTYGLVSHDDKVLGFLGLSWLISLEWYISVSILTGFSITAYWYIPFVMLVFLLSPFFVAFIEQSMKIKIASIVVLLLIACLVHRPVNNVLVFQSVIYFIPVYMIGMLVSENKAWIYEKLKGKELILISLALSLSLVQVMFYANPQNSFKNPFDIATFDLMLPQKITLCFFFISLLHRFENADSQPLSILADVSFPIFFIHGPLISIAGTMLRNGEFSIFQMALFIASIIGACYGFALIIKSILHSKSRYVIGW